MKPTTYRPLSYASRFFNSPSFVDLATFWMARRMGLIATCAVAIPQCALVAAAVYVSALCGGLMGLFLDGAFSRNLLTGVFELDSFFSPVLLFCRCASSLLIGTRTVYVTLFVRNITTARNAVCSRSGALGGNIYPRVLLCGTFWAETGRRVGGQ
jgi:hypothetical protein